MKEVTLHQQEQARLHVLNSVLMEEITIGQAAELMDLSERHVRRLLAAYRELGAGALAHGNRDRRPHNAVPEAVAAAVVRLAATHYPGANHTHLTELLEEHEGLALSRPTVRRILTRAGMPSPRRRRPPQHRVRRERMPRAGMLLQLDGSHHAWLEQRGPRFALLLAVDDATGAVVHALFGAVEDARGYFLLMEEVLRRSGIPLALYNDRHAVFRASAQQRAGGEASTQFARAMAELGVRLIFARSPQAKGRVERMAGTFQDRLVTELRLASATTIGEAQAVLERFLPRFNARFAVAARQPEPAWRPLDPRSTSAASSPSGTPAPSRATTPSSTTGARCSCCLPRSGAATPARASRCWSAPAANSRSVTRARPSPPGSPHPAQACCASAAPSWRSTLRWSASLWVSAPEWPRPTSRSFLPRRTGPPPTVPHRRPGSSRCARPPRASRRSGRPSARHNCRGSRCAPPPACSASPATRSAAMCSPAAHPDARVRHHLPSNDQRERTFSLNC